MTWMTSSELISTRIKAHAGKLGLTHLAASLDAEQFGYLDFLDLIIEEELGIRDGRRFRAAVRRLSKLPHHKTIDEFDFSFQPSLDARKVRDLAALRTAAPPLPITHQRTAAEWFS